MKKFGRFFRKLNMFLFSFLLVFGTIFHFPIDVQASVNDVTSSFYEDPCRTIMVLFPVASNSSQYIDFPSDLSSGVHSFDITINSNISFSGGIDFVDWGIISYSRTSISYWDYESSSVKSNYVSLNLPINGGTTTFDLDYNPSQRYYLFFRGTPTSTYLSGSSKVSCTLKEHQEPVVRPDNYVDFSTLTNTDLIIYQTSGSIKTVVEERSLFLDSSFTASLGSETSGYIGRIVHHFRSPDYDVGTRVYYDLSIEYNGTGAMLQDARLLTDSEKNIVLHTRSTSTGYVLSIGGYSDITSSFAGFDVVVDVAYSGLPLGHLFTSNSDTLGGYSYPLEDENEIVKGFDDLTNGYQNNDMDSSKGELDSSLAGLDDAENDLFNPAKSQLDSYEFVDISATQGIVTGIGFVSTFLQSFYTSSGGLDGLGIITAVGFSVMLVSIVIGLYRHFTK